MILVVEWLDHIMLKPDTTMSTTIKEGRGPERQKPKTIQTNPTLTGKQGGL